MAILVHKANFRGIMFNMKAFLLIIVATFAGCSTTETFSEVEYKNVRQIMMHEEGKYSLIYLDEAQKAHFVKIDEDKTIPLNIFFDVPMTGTQTARIKFVTYNGNHYGTFVRESEIHLYENGKVNGAGWNHGKFGSGQTIKVE